MERRCNPRLRMPALTLACLLILSLAPPAAAEAGDAAGPVVSLLSQSLVVSGMMTHPYLSDPLFRDAGGRLHLGASGLAPYDCYYLSSFDDGITWPVVKNITVERTASKGGTVYIDNSTGSGLYLGFFNVSGYNLNYTSDGGNTWTTGAYRFIPGSGNGLPGYRYPLGSVYDGRSTVYALTWSSKYHSGNGKIGVSKTTDLGVSWTSLAGVASANTLVLDPTDSYAVDAADLVIDVGGNLYILYMACDTAGRWNLKACNAATGQRELVRADLGYSGLATTAVTAWVDRDGRQVHVAFVETGPDGKSGVYHAVRDQAGTWSPPTLIGSDGHSRRPYSAASALDTAGNAYVVWSTYDGSLYRMYAAVLLPAAGWTPVAEVDEVGPSPSPHTPGLSAHPNGQVEMVWTQMTGSVRTLRYGTLGLTGDVEPEDGTPPDIAPVVTGTLGDNGWYVSDVSVSWMVSDPESELVSVAGNDPVTISQDTPGITLTCEATSAGGTSIVSITIKRDATPPVLSSIRTPAANANGWNNSEVTVVFVATDGLSGLDTVTHPVTISSEGAGQEVTGVATDLAGNSASLTVGGISIDCSPPEVAIAAPPDGCQYYLNQPVTAAWSAADGLSGLAVAAGTAPTGAAVDTAAVGEKSFTVTASDLADNQTTVTHAYQVLYVYKSVLPPLKNDGRSVFRLGSTIPVKFQLQDALGAYVDNAVARLYLSCGGAEIEATATSAVTQDNYFRYDSREKQYIFELATRKLVAATWRLRIALDDGSSKFVSVTLR